MSRYPLKRLLLLAGNLILSYGVTAQDVRFFTTTGVSLAFPVAALQTATQNGRGTTFNIEYRLSPSFSVAGAWDNSTLPVQSANLLAKLDPALRGTVTELKGDYITNALGLYSIRYFRKSRMRPFLIAGAGLNIITVPAPVYHKLTGLLSLESASTPTGFVTAGFGVNWQFSKPVALFGEADMYVVPASSPVATGSNNYLTAKFGLRFPLF